MCVCACVVTVHVMMCARVSCSGHASFMCLHRSAMRASSENHVPCSCHLLTQERNAFVEWRRELAQLEEQERLVLTPFEKNLEVWRQLWRVLERSDIVVQVRVITVCGLQRVITVCGLQRVSVCVCGIQQPTCMRGVE